MSTDVPKRERKATWHYKRTRDGGDEDEPTVEMKLKHLENDFERTSQAITDDIMKYRGIELEIEDLKVEHQRRKDNTDKVSIEDIPDLQEQIEVLNGDLRELKADLERFRTEDVADLGTKIQNLKDELEVLTQDTEDTEEHKAEANEKVQTMKGSLHQLNTYSESEREKRYALHKKITDLESKLGLREKQKPVDGFGDENFVQDSSGDQPSETDIHTACREGDLDRVKQLLSGPEANDSLDKNGTSLLMTAVEYGHRDEFDFLVSKGFDVYQVDKFGNNVLHVACIGGDVDLVSYIITQNIVDINSRGQFGRTPVMAAAEKVIRSSWTFL